jgi:hypothetical protein
MQDGTNPAVLKEESSVSVAVASRYYLYFTFAGVCPGGSWRGMS